MRRTWALKGQLERGWGLPARGLPRRSAPPSRAGIFQGPRGVGRFADFRWELALALFSLAASSREPSISLWPCRRRRPVRSAPPSVLRSRGFLGGCSSLWSSGRCSPGVGPVGSEVLFLLCAQGLGQEDSGYSSVSRISRVYGGCCGHGVL